MAPCEGRRTSTATLRSIRRRAHPEANSARDSARGLPHSMVMMVQMSCSASTTASYHLHRSPAHWDALPRLVPVTRDLRTIQDKKRRARCIAALINTRGRRVSTCMRVTCLHVHCFSFLGYNVCISQCLGCMRRPAGLRLREASTDVCMRSCFYTHACMHARACTPTRPWMRSCEAACSNIVPKSLCAFLCHRGKRKRNMPSYLLHFPRQFTGWRFNSEQEHVQSMCS